MIDNTFHYRSFVLLSVYNVADLTTRLTSVSYSGLECQKKQLHIRLEFSK